MDARLQGQRVGKEQQQQQVVEGEEEQGKERQGGCPMA
jgi:hypothetical protein